MAFPFIAAAAGIGANLLGDVLDRSAAKKAKEDALNAWKALLIPAQDTERRADQYGDDVYTRTMGELNTGAFAYAGALNPETIRTLAFSKMGVARSQTETAVKEEDYRYNKQVQQQMAQIQAQPLPTIDVTGALGAGVAGYFGGRQLEMSASLIGMQASMYELWKEDMRNKKKPGSNGFFNSNITDFGLGAKGAKPFTIETPKISMQKPETLYANPLRPASLANPIYPDSSEFDFYKWKRQLLFK